MSKGEEAIGITLKGILVNAFLVLIKGTSGILGNSYALVADAIESSADIFTSFIVWLGLRTAARAPDEDHPYGHGKAEPIAALFVALFMVGAAILISINAIHYILTPHRSPEVYTAFILLGVILVKEWLFRKAHAIAEHTQSTAVSADAWHHRSDAITSLAALLGIIIALTFGQGYESADDWAALVAVVIILVNAYRTFREALYEIMDTAAPVELVKRVREIALLVHEVSGLDKCYVRKMGVQYYVDIHILVDENLSVREGHRIAHEVKDELMQQLPQIADVLTHVEPFSVAKTNR